MPNQQWPHGDEIAETGPDYVALVIEWDDLEDQPTQVSQRPALEASPDLVKKVLLGLGALGAVLLARWGVHRLRHA